MFHIEKMVADDFSFAVQLTDTMNWNMIEEDFKFMIELEPNGCFVLWDDSERIGVATSISFGKVGWFGNLIVHEDHRERGAGTLLLKHAIDYLKSKNVETIGLYAYPQLLRFYGNLGFRSDEDFLVLRGKAFSSTTKSSSKEVKEENVEAIIDFDNRCFGASRRKLLKHILFNADNIGYMSTDNDAITGYVAAKVYEGTAEVGPAVCNQSRDDIAIALLRAVLDRLKGFEIFMCVTRRSTAILDMLFKAGFKEDFRVARMFSGPAVCGSCIYIAESLERG